MINRRQLLTAAGLAAATGGLAATLTGCRATPPAPSADSPSPTATNSATTPTFRPYTGVTPTKPALPNGTAAYFESFPLEPTAFGLGPVGTGAPVVCHTFINASPAPMAENTWWQALNEAVGVEFQLLGVPAGDYFAKFQTTIAGGDLPDMMSIQPLRVPHLAELLESTFQDLTDHLAGDAILDYPGLANLPSYVWSSCTYGGRIRALPIQRFALSHGYALRTDLARTWGVPTQPTSGAEFHEMLRGLSDEKQNRFATNNVVYLLEIVAEMMGVPNDWAEEDGVFTKDIETPEYREALEFVRRCWQEKLIHPSCWDANYSSQSQALFDSGNASLILGGLTWMANGALTRATTPEADIDSFQMHTWDGSGPAGRWVGDGSPYQVAIKQSTPERLTELLKVSDWLAAPWGTQEYNLIRSGVEGTHYTRNSAGVIEPTERAAADKMSPLIYMGSGPQVHFNTYPDLALRGYEHEAQAMDVPVHSAARGLDSPTAQTKTGQLTRILTAAQSDIITGRAPVASWDNTVKEWRSKGGDEIRRELTQAQQRGQ